MGLEIVGYIAIPLLLIDVFYFLYTSICKFYMRRRGIDEKDLNKVRKPWIIITYSVFTIVSIVSVFALNSYYQGTFLDNLKNELLVIVILCLLTYGVWSVAMHFKHYFGFAKDVYSGMQESKKDFDHIADKFKDDGEKK